MFTSIYAAQHAHATAPLHLQAVNIAASYDIIGLLSSQQFADRICVQVVEAGLGFLPFTELTVTTPTGSQYCGVDFAKSLCGVSIIRSGESMENALRACCKGIKIGKILVHRYGC